MDVGLVAAYSAAVCVGFLFLLNSKKSNPECFRLSSIFLCFSFLSFFAEERENIGLEQKYGAVTAARVGSVWCTFRVTQLSRSVSHRMTSLLPSDCPTKNKHMYIHPYYTNKMVILFFEISVAGWVRIIQLKAGCQCTVPSGVQYVSVERVSPEEYHSRANLNQELDDKQVREMNN